MTQHYLLDNAAPQASARFAALSTIFDPGTIRHLEACGVRDGWHCCEVGAGGGSIAKWLAGRVGVKGSVLATDIDPRFLQDAPHPRLEAVRHDIEAEDLPGEAFDLVHTRLLLMHVTDVDRVLRRMVAAVKPGGWLLVEDFEVLETEDAERTPALHPIPKTMKATLRVMADRGIDLRCGRSLVTRLRALGLTDLAGEGRVFMWGGASPAASLRRANYEQLRESMIAAGLITVEEYATDLAELDEPDAVTPSPIMWAAWGRVPQPTPC